MFLSKIHNHLFFTTGKTGTRTLLSVPEMIELSRPNSEERGLGPYLTPKQSLRILEKQTIMHSSNLHIIVRDPHSRLISGLFEIIVKKIMTSTFPNNLTTVQLSILYEKTYWDRAIQSLLDLAPHNFSATMFDTLPFWRFHIGNWINAAIDARDKFNGRIVPLTNLSDHLTSLGLEHTTHNTNNQFLIDCNLDPEKVIGAFVAGLMLTEQWPKLLAYIEPDIKLYNSLL